MILLCTTQGLAVQQDGRGQQKLFHHSVAINGKIHRHWLEAERSAHKVGGAQKETAAEKADALKRGKATASVIGVRAMGTRFNVLMTVQVPLKQKPPKRREYAFSKFDDCGSMMTLSASMEMQSEGAGPLDIHLWSMETLLP